jgi:hypothetical protein
MLSDCIGINENSTREHTLTTDKQSFPFIILISMIIKNKNGGESYLKIVRLLANHLFFVRPLCSITGTLHITIKPLSHSTIIIK